MKIHRSIPQSLGACFAWAFTFVVFIAVSTAHAGTHVLQFAAGTANATIAGDHIVLDSPVLNGKPTLKPIISQDWTAVYNPHPTGVYYITGATASAGRWSIFNEDLAAMPMGAKFNLLVTTTMHSVNATPMNSVDDYTAFGAAKGKPAEILLFTHMWNPFLSLQDGVYVQNQGLDYPASSNAKNPLFDKWYIFNQAGTPPAATTYFILDTVNIPSNLHAVKLLHTSTVSNDAANQTTINDSGALNVSTNIVFFSPVGDDANKALGVYFDGANWAIFNEDQTTFSANEKFNVLMFPAVIP